MLGQLPHHILPSSLGTNQRCTATPGRRPAGRDAVNPRRHLELRGPRATGRRTSPHRPVQPAPASRQEGKSAAPPPARTTRHQFGASPAAAAVDAGGGGSAREDGCWLGFPGRLRTPESPGRATQEACWVLCDVKIPTGVSLEQRSRETERCRRGGERMVSPRRRRWRLPDGILSISSSQVVAA